jgi:starch phosphorylase
MSTEVGTDNMFIFGLTVEEARALRATGYNPRDVYDGHAELRCALDMIAGGYFSGDAPDLFRPIVDALLTHDHFLLLADYVAYVECQDRVDALYRDSDEWTRRAVRNVAGMGRFSSDRAVQEYASAVWGVHPVTH